eukprot:50890-Chlamydomonas_euryale.AAC.5
MDRLLRMHERCTASRSTSPVTYMQGCMHGYGQGFMQCTCRVPFIVTQAACISMAGDSLEHVTHATCLTGRTCRPLPGGHVW